VGAERLARPHPKRREYDIVPVKRAGQLVRVVGIASHHREQRVLAPDLLRRADECRGRVSAREGEVEDVCSGLAGGAEDEESRGHVLVTGQTGPM